MASSKKRKTKKKAPAKQVAGAMSPIQYIKSGRARSLNIHSCYVNEDWTENGLASVVVNRVHVTGNITIGIYLVDVFCLGLKNTSFRFNMPYDEYEEFFDMIYEPHDSNQIEIDYNLAHSIIYGAINYAAKMGFAPEKDWVYSQMILLPEKSPDVELVYLEFGKDGQPFYISGPNDRVPAILEKLKKAVGEGNYHYVAETSGYGHSFNSKMTNLFSDDTDDDDFDEDDSDDNYDDDDIQEAEYEEVKS